ncbi:hypothetical protein ABZ865_30270 [Streptomyces sp. NPDC047085]|uniref:hypothetical protein n=1 Tax=Streptomyces sp. NPDC047085 TaxID=3155140 RepID=UPI0033D7F75F
MRPQIAAHPTTGKGVEHRPRGIVQAFRTGKDARADAGPKGRPKGSGDMVPRDEISARVGDLLDEDPTVTLATVQERVGLSYAAAARALPWLRGERIADLLQDEPDVTPEEAATRLGYPTAVQRTALAAPPPNCAPGRSSPTCSALPTSWPARGWPRHRTSGCSAWRAMCSPRQWP